MRRPQRILRAALAGYSKDLRGRDPRPPQHELIDNFNQPCRSAAGTVGCASGCAANWGANVDLGWLLWGRGAERRIRQSAVTLLFGLRRCVR